MVTTRDWTIRTRTRGTSGVGGKKKRKILAIVVAAEEIMV